MWIRIRIPLGPWMVRIRVQSYKMQEKADSNQQLFFSFFFSSSLFSQEFLKSEPKKVATLQGIGSDLKIISFFYF